MRRDIVIDPVTRIEGHATITIRLDDAGQVADAHFHVTQFRGFERIVQGRPVHEMPSIMAPDLRDLPGQPPGRSPRRATRSSPFSRRRPAPTWRRVMNLAQVVQSNALSFFHLSASTCCSASTPTAC